MGMGQAAKVNFRQTAVIKPQRAAPIGSWQPAGHRILKQTLAADAASMVPATSGLWDYLESYSGTSQIPPGESYFLFSWFHQGGSLSWRVAPPWGLSNACWSSFPRQRPSLQLPRVSGWKWITMLSFPCIFYYYFPCIEHNTGILFMRRISCSLFKYMF